MDSSASSAPLGQSLCLACGLCCQGLLHARAGLASGEEELAERLGLEVHRFRDRLCFHLPCPRFEGGCCGSYPVRPVACGNYRCRLLRQVESGDLPLADGLAVVTQTQHLIDSIRQQIHSPETSQALWRQLSDALEAGAGTAAAGPLEGAAPELLLDVASLLALCRSRFFEPER